MLISLGLPTDRLPQHAELATAAAISDVSQRAEAAGYDAVFVTDHPFPPSKWINRGGHHSIDPFVALAIAAAATTRLRLQTNLLIAGYRNPFITAHSIATLDVVSRGRTIIGLGAGYLEPEFAALGAEFTDRGARFDVAIEAMTAAWRGEPVTMTGADFTADANVLQPLPLQQPHPPLLIGGNSTAAIRRAVRLADGWIPMPSPASASRFVKTPGIESMDQLRQRIRIARELAAEHSRTEPLQIWFTPWAMSGFASKEWDSSRLLAELDDLAALGVVGVTLLLPGTTLNEFVRSLEAFAQDVIAG